MPQEAGGAAAAAAGADAAEHSEALLPLLLVADALRQRLAALEAGVRAAAAQASAQLLAAEAAAGAAAAAAPCDGVAAARLRLAAQPPLQHQLAAFAAVGPASPVLAAASQAVGEVSGAIEGLVLDLLLGRVRSQLQVWRALHAVHALLRRAPRALGCAHLPNAELVEQRYALTGSLGGEPRPAGLSS